MKRRDVLKALGCTALGAGMGSVFPGCLRRTGADAVARRDEGPDSPDPSRARYYSKHEDGSIQCELCFHRCRVPSGTQGFCRKRVNRGGKLYNVVYGRPTSVVVEPTEKEPLHHFLPGSQMLCIGTASCNYRCRFCHNWQLSQRSVAEMHKHYSLAPPQMVAIAKRSRVPAVSYTYNEPTVFYEYMYDIAVEARGAGLRNILHTNGGMSPEPMAKLLPHMDAATVDLKGFTSEYYRKICGAELEPVLATLEAIKADGTWLEVVNLVVPELNDAPEEIEAMCAWLVKHLGPDVPLHFSRFFPAHAMKDLAPTPIATLERCRGIATEAGLRYVSIGNVPGHEANSTFCPSCKTCIIERHHFTVSKMHMRDGACAKCGYEIPGVWS